MSSTFYSKIRRNPRFTELVDKRNRFTACLLTLVMTLFFGFIGVVSFRPKLIGQRLSETSALTVGVVVEFSLFVLFLAVAGLYVRRANGEFDIVTRDLIKQVEAEVQQ
jgi:uncharacterized membrane protein (DUF485 family)